MLNRVEEAIDVDSEIWKRDVQALVREFESSTPWKQEVRQVVEEMEASKPWKQEMRQVFEEVLSQKFEEIGLGKHGAAVIVTPRNEEAPRRNTRTVMRSWTAGQVARSLDRNALSIVQKTPTFDTVVPYPPEPPSPMSTSRRPSMGASSEHDPADMRGRRPSVPKLVAPPVTIARKPSGNSLDRSMEPVMSVGSDQPDQPVQDVKQQGELGSENSRRSPMCSHDSAQSAAAFRPKAWGLGMGASGHSMTSECDYVQRHCGRLPSVNSLPKISMMRQKFQKRAMTSALPARFENASYMQIMCATIVMHPRFDYLVSIFILANAGTMGASADHLARTQNIDEPTWITALEKIFAVVFTLELLLRLVVHKAHFFCGSGWTWNLFDFCLVTFQIVEEIMSALALKTTGWTGTLRLLRLIRVVRLARILRLIRELRVLVSSISNSMKSLVWTVLLMFLIIYSVSLCITQLVADHRLKLTEEERADPAKADDIADLERYYGSLTRCQLSLFEAITGGMDWDALVVPLMRQVSPVLAAILVVYVAISVLAMMNVVTGVFVDSVLASAKADKEQFLLNNARELFKTSDEEMDWEAFKGKIDMPQMIEFFRGIDVDPSEAQGIFSLIDLDESGSVNADEFLNGCVRLQGPSKALETAVLLQEVRGLRRAMQRFENDADG